MIYPIILPKGKYQRIDLSQANLSISNLTTLDFATYMNNLSETGIIHFGGYLEKRAIYRDSEHFNVNKDKRTIHLGLDFWAKKNTPIYAIDDGIIHSFQDNNNLGDYGPTLIIYHPKWSIFSLYGHLSRNSLQKLKIGTPIKMGEEIASLGAYEENGNWSPHLHFQLIKNLEGKMGDYPGVCLESEINFYSDNCPDPEKFIYPL